MSRAIFVRCKGCGKKFKEPQRRGFCYPDDPEVKLPQSKCYKRWKRGWMQIYQKIPRVVERHSKVRKRWREMNPERNAETQRRANQTYYKKNRKKLMAQQRAYNLKRKEEKHE